ncbi:hypothetical protein EPUS_04324 [Endocarpon pusillum Z07020]|uniref:Heterokaryon incompatibility domain-containing protein n=1 Tax=Endocarpon pusillum (strain Z07020 / HMAS-L-300199) TaxID=1263415 RepID=U1GF39_ENDPU|nr:uncharacterized protein EPUS_04324 [Endocarpon pusillum Z07020]ERF76247.1 hypothetical protein EPUS_04324 [Endocarpon pusillum Z07020]
MESDSFDAFCDFCRENFNECSPWAGGVYKATRIRSIASLMTSRAQGCSLCRLILVPTNIGFLGHDHVAFELGHSDRFPDVLELRFRPSSVEGTSSGIYKWIDLIRINSVTYPTIRHLPHQSTWPRQTRTQASKWITECWDRHQLCHSQLPKAKRQTTRLPTRLIDVGTVSRPYARLVHSSNLSSETQYMTLSHCWGQTSSLVLRKDNFRKFIADISSELPIMYADAIQVTRELGIQYIWVDSLCIIQDSEEDWRHESAQMDKVYSNSRCTIAGAMSKNSDEGLFFDRAVPAATPCKISCTWNPNHPETFLCYDDSPWIDLEFGPLYSRAWVVQERLLSPCMLLFADDQVYWECSELIASDSCPSGLPLLIHRLKSTWSSVVQCQPLPLGNIVPATEAELSLSRSNAELGESAIERLMGAWAYIVSAYTYGGLTFTSDKLVAISGLARQIRKVLDAEAEDYLAGLWRYKLARQLLWSSSNQAESKQVRAPSWSWSSVDGWATPVFLEILEYATTRLEYWLDTIVILQASTYPIADPFGPVSGGHLLVQGPICRIKRPTESVKDPHWWRNAHTLFTTKEGILNLGNAQCSWSIDNLSPDKVEVDSVYLMPSAVVRFARRVLRGETSSTSGIAKTSPKKDSTRRLDSSLEENVGGLAMVKMLAVKGQYQRIGAFKLTHKGAQADLRKAIGARTLREEDYLDFDGSESYTIKIV